MSAEPGPWVGSAVTRPLFGARKVGEETEIPVGSAVARFFSELAG